MARVRYLGPETVTVPELGRSVEPDEVVEVPDDRYEGYACQPGTWEAVEEPKQEESEPPPAAPKKTLAARPQKEG
ncbi:hypothetical protein AB0L04_00475 [Streptomyces glaucescens]|uniref:hypothetical protein n=1 Tax=Streptomyces glaucescens TaxID=1907 RepID=UPI00344BE034